MTMLYQYESVLNPQGPDERHINTMQTDTVKKEPSLEELFQLQSEIEKKLENHRSREPSLKRKNKSEYRKWVKSTHDYLDELKNIRDSIFQRKTENPL